MKIRIKKLLPDAKMPERQHKTDAGFDLTAISIERIGLFKYRYGTGLAMEIPTGYEGEIRPRSSIFKTGMILSNSPGTIDAGYRGEIMAVFYALPFLSKPYKTGERIAQILIKPVPMVEFTETTGELSKSSRGQNGYGSTGR